MKRIKALNGYTIYEANERDEKKYTGIEAGNFYVYFSSDIRDFGIAYSYPEFECGSIEEAEENCSGNYARAKEILENAYTAIAFEEIEEVEKKLDAMTKEEVSTIETLEDLETAETENEEYKKYCKTMSIIDSLKDKKLAYVDGFKIGTVYDCFGYADKNEDPVFDLEFNTITGKYYHLRNVSLDRLLFE